MVAMLFLLLTGEDLRAKEPLKRLPMGLSFGGELVEGVLRPRFIGAKREERSSQGR